MQVSLSLLQNSVTIVLSCGSSGAPPKQPRQHLERRETALQPPPPLLCLDF